jgi:hypothetical protein
MPRASFIGVGINYVLCSAIRDIIGDAAFDAKKAVLAEERRVAKEEEQKVLDQAYQAVERYCKSQPGGMVEMQRAVRYLAHCGLPIVSTKADGGYLCRLLDAKRLGSTRQWYAPVLSAGTPGSRYTLESTDAVYLFSETARAVRHALSGLPENPKKYSNADRYLVERLVSFTSEINFPGALTIRDQCLSLLRQYTRKDAEVHFGATQMAHCTHCEGIPGQCTCKGNCPLQDPTSLSSKSVRCVRRALPAAASSSSSSSTALRAAPY